MDNIDLEKYTQHLRQRGLSRSTICSYLHYNKNFLKLANKCAREVMVTDIRAYLEHLLRVEKVSNSTLNTAYSALKSYYSHLYKRKFFIDLPRAKNDFRAPTVLSKREVARMIKMTENPKHKCILSILYGCGLRISEITRLRIKDLSLERKDILIRGAKGWKDRYVGMPKSMIEDLAMQVGSKNLGEYLFSGRLIAKPLTTMSVYKAVKQAAVRAGVKKDVSPHTLRHSFAAHLLADGVSIRYIQKLLGHTCLDTTLKYRKVSNKSHGKTVSPLD